jgi:AraC-like DNA-binding protein
MTSLDAKAFPRQGALSRLQNLKDPRRFADYFVGTPPLSMEPLRNILLFPRFAAYRLVEGVSYHERYVAMINCEGTGKILIDGKLFAFEPGAAHIVFPFQFHSFVDVQPTGLRWLIVTFEAGADTFLAPLRNLQAQLSGRAWRLAEDLLEAYLSAGRPTQPGNNAIIFHASLLLNELAAIAEATASAGNAEQGMGDAIHAINAYVLSHLNTALRIEDIGKAVALSPSRVRAIFRQTTKMGIGAYVKELKIRRALQLLATTGMNVSQIADECGYDSLHSFSRMFAKRMGMPARQYRISMRNRAVSYRSA